MLECIGPRGLHSIPKVVTPIIHAIIHAIISIASTIEVGSIRTRTGEGPGERGGRRLEILVGVGAVDVFVIDRA